MTVIDAALRRELKSHLSNGIDIFTEFLDAERFPGSEQAAIAEEYLRAKYAKRSLDLVIAAGPDALKFLMQRRASLFPGIPLIFGGVAEQTAQALSLPPETVGVIGRYDPEPTVDLALRLQPDARHLFVVTGASKFDRSWEEKARRALHSYEGRLDIRYLSGLPMSELTQELGNLPERSIVLYLSMFQDGAGKDFVPGDVIEQVAKTANAPVYAVYDLMVGRGVVGGSINSYESLAISMAQLGLRVLAGERPTTSFLAQPTNIVDWRQMKRWGLRESKLPPGSVVQFREPSLWEAYWPQIVFVVALLILQSFLIVAMILQDARRRRAEREVALWRQELTHLARVATLGELSGAVAHELNQPLTAILSNAGAARLILEQKGSDFGELQEILADIAADATRGGEIIQHLRTLFSKAALRSQPLVLNEVVLEALKLVHNDLVARRVVAVSSLAPELPRVRGDRVQLQQVLLNLIHNACDAMVENAPGERKLVVSTATDENATRISVTDHGTGIREDRLSSLFQPFFTTKSRGLGLGLSICRSIIEAHGGSLWAFNNPGRGATFCVSLPADGGGRL
jgi:signal transduction histidine kinase